MMAELNLEATIVVKLNDSAEAIAALREAVDAIVERYVMSAEVYDLCGAFYRLRDCANVRVN